MKIILGAVISLPPISAGCAWREIAAARVYSSRVFGWKLSS